MFNAVTGCIPTCFVDEMCAGGVVLLVPASMSTRSVGEEMSPPRIEPTPAVKKPSAVVCPVSQIG